MQRKIKNLLFGVCLSLLVGAAALTTASALSATEPQNDLMKANIEALSQNEGAATCTFNSVDWNENKNKLVCSGHGASCCKRP